MSEKSWTADGLTYTEISAEEFETNHCRFSAGLVEGHHVDTVYFRLEKEQDDVNEVFVILRPDEMAALIGVCGAALVDAYRLPMLPREQPGGDVV